MELQAFVEKHEQLGGDKKNDENIKPMLLF
jgi:hypothetical protein